MSVETLLNEVGWVSCSKDGLALVMLNVSFEMSQVQFVYLWTTEMFSKSRSLKETVLRDKEPLMSLS